MRDVLDQLAYRLLARFSPYTPEYHYRMRAKMFEARSDLLAYSDFRFSYCTAMIRARLRDLYWSVRGFL